MRPREWLTGAIPSAGVGAAFSRHALELAKQANDGKAFSENTLTEDYELPLHLTKLRAKEAFIEPGQAIKSEDQDRRGAYPIEDEYPYIRSDFPSSLMAAVRQKSRWVLGISLQGWQHLGWSRKAMQSYMLWRDRKVLVGNLANFAGYLLVFFTIAIWFVRWGLLENADFPNVVPRDGLIWKLLIINLYIMAIQLAVRFACTFKIYGLVHAIISIPRAVWGNYINFLATTRALFLFFRARRKGGEPIPWEKTDHSSHVVR
jgi:adsorption protein B